MRKFLLVLGLLVVSVGIVSTEAKKPDESPFIGYCSNFGTGVSSFFTSCVNSNFRSVERDLGGVFFSCHNFGMEVDYGFISCIQSNFRQAETLLSGRVWLDTCYNYDGRNLDYSYVSCVNRNFSQIDSVLRK